MTTTARLMVNTPLGWCCVPLEILQPYLVPEGAAQETVGAEPLLTAEAAAAALSVSPRLLEDLARNGTLTHHKVGRFTRFRLSEIAEETRANPVLLGDRPSDRPSAARRNSLNGKG